MTENDESQGLYTHNGHRKYLTISERERFVEAAAKADLVTFTLCLMLCLTGCRISEALAVYPHHVDREDNAVRFKSLKRRGGKVEWRSIPIPSQLVRMLSSISVEGSPLFPISRSTAWRRVKGIMREASIEGPQACPKGMRHYFGVFADRQGIPQPVLQRWMGHSKLENTSIYRQAVGEEEAVFAERLCWLSTRKT